VGDDLRMYGAIEAVVGLFTDETLWRRVIRLVNASAKGANRPNGDSRSMLQRLSGRLPESSAELVRHR
jgi:hypothetical protein